MAIIGQIAQLIENAVLKLYAEKMNDLKLAPCPRRRNRNE